MSLRDDLIRDEGERRVPYDDVTGQPLKSGDTLRGKLTISVGVNISDGISSAESDSLFAMRLLRVEEEAPKKMPWFPGLPEPVQRGLLNMLYNLGWPRLSGFAHMLIALEDHQWERAAKEAEDSLWANQVGDRAKRIAALYRSCNG